jgi:ferredoxin
MSAKRRLVIEPIACTGHGVCAELFPEWVELDEWGFPIIDLGPVPEHLLGHARRAVGGCPKLALWLLEIDRERA